MISVNDTTTDAVRLALAGLSARQRAIADNVANLETPGYKAKRVSFESSLERALAGGGAEGARIVESRSTAEGNNNGNNVSIDEETIELLDTNMRYELFIEAINAKFRLLRSSIKG